MRQGKVFLKNCCVQILKRLHALLSTLLSAKTLTLHTHTHSQRCMCVCVCVCAAPLCFNSLRKFRNVVAVAVADVVVVGQTVGTSII